MSAAIGDFLAPEDVFINVAAPDKDRLLQVLSYRAATRLGLDEDSVANEVLNREALGSTGIGKGVAIPHARLAGLKKPFAMLARLRGPTSYDAIDGEPVDLVVLLLMPADPGQNNLLAAIARQLRDDETRARMRAARTAAELYETFRGA